jgi:hypothetical protein
LERIAAEKARLVKEGKIKADKKAKAYPVLFEFSPLLFERVDARQFAFESLRIEVFDGDFAGFDNGAVCLVVDLLVFGIFQGAGRASQGAAKPGIRRRKGILAK